MASSLTSVLKVGEYVSIGIGRFRLVRPTDPSCTKWVLMKGNPSAAGTPHKAVRIEMETERIIQENADAQVDWKGPRLDLIVNSKRITKQRNRYSYDY